MTGPRERGGSRFARLLPALAAPVLAAVGAGAVLRIWAANLRVPLDPRPDAIFNIALIKGLIENGGVLSNPSLGAPAGQRLDDFPVGGDLLHLILVRGLTLLSRDAVLVANVYFLLSFPLVAAVAWWMLRRLSVSPWGAVVGATLFALLPVHFVRGINHLYLGTYFAVPLGACLVLALFAGDPLDSRQRRFTLLAALVIGFSGFYYAVFTCLLALAAALLRSFAEGRQAPWPAALAIVGVIGIGVSVGLAPAVLRRIHDGPNRLAGHRSPAETEGYGLKLVQLVLPIEHHRVPALAELKRRVVTTALLGGEHPDAASLGAVASAGFVWLAILLLGFCASGGVWPGGEPPERHAAVAAALAFVIATLGGVSLLIAYLIHPQIRCWGRLSLFIAFFALFALLVRIDASVPEPRTRAGILAAILILGLLDQTSPAQEPDYASLSTDFRSDAVLVSEIERRLPVGAAVFQLPYMPFPEAPPLNALHDSGHLKPYLHSTSLRWSYGAMKGRAEDWVPSIRDEPIPTLLRGVAAAGFAGLTVDRLGYPDRGASLEAAVEGLIGSAPLQSPDARLAFFDLRPFARRLAEATSPEALARLGEAVRTPIRCDWGPGFFAEERSATGRFRWAGPRARLEIENASAGKGAAVFEAALAGAGAGTVRATWPDGTREELPLGVRLVRTLALRPGRNVAEFTTDLPRSGSGDSRDLRAMFVEPLCRDPRLAPREDRGQP